VAKSERLFEMLEYIKEYPYLNAQDLARLCNVSERGIYRYLNTLSRAGISVRFQEDGYKLLDSELDFLKKVDVESLRGVRELLSIGMENCDDDELLQYGGDFIDLINENLPKSKLGKSDEIRILPTGMRSPRYGGTVTIGHSSKPDIINPILTHDTISVTLMNLIFSSLVKLDGTGKPIPDLARNWKISEDGLKWTFFLRDDVKFHDGHPLTAADVEFTYRSIIPTAERYKLISRVETEGNYVFRMILKHPFAPFIRWMARAIAPKHLLEDADLHDNPFNRRPIGSGPFKLTDWTEDDTMVLDANREYFQQGRPILDTLILKSYPDRASALQAITKGEMDIALDLAASDLLFASKQGPFRIYSAQGSSYYAVFFNLEDPLFADARIRKALDYAIDRESIIKNQLKGRSVPCTGPFSTHSWSYNPDVQTTLHDIEKSRELLEQAGWVDTDGDGILDKDGQPFEISITVPNISDSLERLAVAIKIQLMQVGIRTKLVYTKDSELHKTPFQAILARIPTGSDPDEAYRLWNSRSEGTNMISYENGFVDELLEQGRQTTDLEKRKAIYHKIHKMIHDDYPAIFLASGFESIGSIYRFRNPSFFSMLHFLTTIKDWQIVEEGREGIARKHLQKANDISS